MIPITCLTFEVIKTLPVLLLKLGLAVRYNEQTPAVRVHDWRSKLL